MKGEIKPFGYSIKRFILKHILRLPAQKMVYSSDEFLPQAQGKEAVG